MNIRCAGLAAIIVSGLMMGCGGGGSSSSSNSYGGGGMVGYTATALVSDGSGTPHTDSNLVNGWGVAFNPNGYAWVADAATAKSTLYDGNGVPQSLIVSIPTGSAGAASPTGIVYNGSTDFVVTGGSGTGSAQFIFASESGTISAWSPAADATNALKMVDNGASGAVYKGLALASDSGANKLYATDFHNGRVDVFNASFAPVTVAGGFVDATLPAGYAPFGIQQLGGKLYVSYAKQDAAAHDNVPGAGLGIVDVFDTQGNLLTHLVAAGGSLDSPWGIVIAPATFGTLSNLLLVGNFGDGKINAFNATTGAFMGTINNSSGSPIVIDGLWGIAFGNGLFSQSTKSLFYAAGPLSETHGRYGKIDAN